jgi:hypothetical protein
VNRYFVGNWLFVLSACGHLLPKAEKDISPVEAEAPLAFGGVIVQVVAPERPLELRSLLMIQSLAAKR